VADKAEEVGRCLPIQEPVGLGSHPVEDGMETENTTSNLSSLIFRNIRSEIF
jgi:hypothetical protein